MMPNDVRDCTCGCPPNRHLLVRVGSLAVVGGACVDCQDCEEFMESNPINDLPARHFHNHTSGSTEPTVHRNGVEYHVYRCECGDEKLAVCVC